MCCLKLILSIILFHMFWDCPLFCHKLNDLFTMRAYYASKVTICMLTFIICLMNIIINYTANIILVCMFCCQAYEVLLKLLFFDMLGHLFPNYNKICIQILLHLCWFLKYSFLWKLHQCS